MVDQETIDIIGFVGVIGVLISGIGLAGYLFKYLVEKFGPIVALLFALGVSLLVLGAAFALERWDR